MTPEQLVTLRQVLTEAVDKHIKNGGTIISGFFGYGNRVCPIKALIGDLGPGVRYNEVISSMLGFPISQKNMSDFVHGFDGGWDQSNLMTQLGVEFRAKYIIG